MKKPNLIKLPGKPPPEPEKPYVNQELVDMLADALAAAEKGQVRALVGAVMMGDLSIQVCSSLDKPESVFAMLGGLDVVARAVYDNYVHVEED